LHNILTYIKLNYFIIIFFKGKIKSQFAYMDYIWCKCENKKATPHWSQIILKIMKLYNFFTLKHNFNFIREIKKQHANSQQRNLIE
jgi:hypothetical protein